ncbi:unnamed protein product [Adineta ricciae]|uniref:Ionotropic glutamate receptor C-terminal domain-containing protein n=1 Tax=Adineta ricciae TaxID=249248 RepID=A0A813SVL3_ADIRI|nr:unnamed protein product [Adineta ricciae]CAF1021405.1 unnamed protein product [Adineta ricciae]
MFFSLISRYALFYLTVGLGHITFIQTAWPTQNNSAVQLLGLFPDAQNTSIPSTFSVHSRAMFKTAIILAQQYDVKINGEYIQWQAAQTGGDVVNALSDMCQAISNSNIMGVVGPAYSREATDITAFAERIGIPVISYATTNPDLSDRTSYPAFYRTIPSDNEAAIAIAKLFTRYNWTSAIIVYQNDAFGTNGAKVINAALTAGAVTIRGTVIFDVTTRSIRGDLQALLTGSSARVVILWADPINTPLILHNAIDVNVLGPQFTWILSSSIPFTTFNQTSYQALVGLLTVEAVTGSIISEPFNQTLLNAACNIWQTYEPETFPGVSKIDYYGLFAFDATWSLIQSLQKVCSSDSSNLSTCPSMIGSSYCFDRSLTNSSNLFSAINDIAFLGVTGQIEFSANETDRLTGVYYVAQNIQPSATGIYFTPVLKYTNRNYWSAYTLANVIVWPGNSLTPPADRPILEGVTLRIAVTQSTPFTMLSYTVDDFGRNTTTYIGYVPDLIALLQYNMKFVPQLILAPATKTYDNIIQDVSNGVYDMMMSDLTITSGRRQIVSFSSSIFDNSLRIIMRESTDESVDFLAFLKTFSFDLWLTLLGSGLFAAVILCIIERQENEILQNRSLLSLLSMGMWYSLGAFVGYGVDFHVRTAAGRLLTLGLYIISIVFVATYTANLTSYLTIAKTTELISSIDDIKAGKLPFNRIGVRLGTSIEAYYLREISNGVKNYYPLSSRQQQYNALLNGLIDASFMDIGVAEYATNNIYCNLTLVGADFETSAFGIAIPKNWVYAQILDVNILSLREAGSLDDLRTKWFQAKTCPEASNVPTSMGLQSLIGLFLTFAIISVLSVILFLYKKRFMLKDYMMSMFRNKSSFTQQNACIRRNPVKSLEDSPPSRVHSDIQLQL